MKHCIAYCITIYWLAIIYLLIIIIISSPGHRVVEGSRLLSSTVRGGDSLLDLLHLILRLWKHTNENTFRTTTYRPPAALNGINRYIFRISASPTKTCSKIKTLSERRHLSSINLTPFFPPSGGTNALFCTCVWSSECNGTTSHWAFYFLQKTKEYLSWCSLHVSRFAYLQSNIPHIKHLKVLKLVQHLQLSQQLKERQRTWIMVPDRWFKLCDLISVTSLMLSQIIKIRKMSQKIKGC